ncbi:unnamed protein product [Oikopleura dioica]|uniref:LIM zinc-binding domain-containing protein n=1 Tax=Oikopleura dioica TaxID=34765 RepID=E4XMZ2_OIKDI|nr:unnamed protein product [Oikopleura dioica]
MVQGIPVPRSRSIAQGFRPHKADKCSYCEQRIGDEESFTNYKEESYHKECFCCEQCFRKFSDHDDIYQFEGKKYCENDFRVLYAPICRKCNNFVDGNVVSALNAEWCLECFQCDSVDLDCRAEPGTPLAQYNKKLFCRPCFNLEKSKSEGKPICQKCFNVVEDVPLRWKGDPYHPYHFNCSGCACVMDHTGRDIGGRLYCLPCHDKQGIPICAACRRPVEGRCVNACGKQWHPEHFVCSTCERPFSQSKYFLGPDNMPYCEKHYNIQFGEVCFNCNLPIKDEVISALEKKFCACCFRCYGCNERLSPRQKFVEFDMKPLCKKCFDKFPSELKKRIKKHSKK